jgi:anti-sigma regulatory factor (Ser/Thr protein kinase)
VSRYVQDGSRSSRAGRERRFLPELGSCGAARAFAAEMVDSDDPRSEDVALVVSELASNAVLHARTPFSVRLSSSDACLRIEVHDSSPTLPVRRHYSTDAVTGRGMGIVASYSDRWGIDATPGGKAVWCEFDMSFVDDEAGA